MRCDQEYTKKAQSCQRIDRYRTRVSRLAGNGSSRCVLSETSAELATPLERFVRRILSSRRLVSGCAGAGLVLGTLLWILLPRTFVSEATILPSTHDDALPAGGSLLSLAGSFGLQLPGSALPESHLYPTILTSERVIRSALETSLDPADPSAGTLFDEISEDEREEEIAREKAIGRIREDVLRVGLDEETGIVRVVARMADPALAHRTVAIFLDELSRYLREERTAESRENREFVEQRRQETARRLSEAEEELRAFHEKNRRRSNSPDLLLAEERLQRRVRVLEELFLELSRQYEVAWIEERQATPILEVLDPPTIRLTPKSPRLGLVGGGGLLLGVCLGSLLSILLESPRRSLHGLFRSARLLFGRGSTS